VKVAVTGKGGVGKTTVAASLARALHALGREVIAVDADPDANLAGTLGHRGADITPLVKLKELVAERVGGVRGDTGAASVIAGGWGGFLRMNPRVDDLPQELGVIVDGVRVLVMGTIDRGRSGCACPENVLLREVLSHLILDARQDVIVDMEAGIEHLGRGTAEGVDLMLVVVEPGWASLETAGRVAKLAADLGIQRVDALANRIAAGGDLAFVHGGLPAAVPLLGALPLDPGLEREARAGGWDAARPFHREMTRVARELVRVADLLAAP
jgi:CO dehydrogenase maturation factor